MSTGARRVSLNLRWLWLLALLWPLTPATATTQAQPLALNDIQVVGTHNSYKQAMDPALLALLEGQFGDAISALDYAHSPLVEQLDRGLRNLELDVFHDPDGGRFAAPRGLALLGAQGLPSAPFDPTPMLNPGFKVLHVQDIDFRSHCATLQDCLLALRQWSQAHPDHLPILITLNAKDATLSDPEATRPLPFDAAAWAALDVELREGLGTERLLLPDEVRGRHDSLREAVRTDGWPPLEGVRGRFLIALDEPEAKLDSYLDEHPSARGRVMFPAVDEEHPAAAVLVINDPVAAGERIRTVVEAGFLVRSRADADTREARTGEVRRREAAFDSGAHFISTDYPTPDPRFGTGYHVVLPGGGVARCNPIRRPDGCPLP